MDKIAQCGIPSITLCQLSAAINLITAAQNTTTLSAKRGSMYEKIKDLYQTFGEPQSFPHILKSHIPDDELEGIIGHEAVQRYQTWREGRPTFHLNCAYDEFSAASIRDLFNSVIETCVDNEQEPGYVTEMWISDPYADDIRLCTSFVTSFSKKLAEAYSDGLEQKRKEEAEDERYGSYEVQHRLTARDVL